MPFENIEVKISKKGEITVRIEGSDEIRLSNFRAFLEEVLGPISHSSRLDVPSWARENQISESRKEELERQQ